METPICVSHEWIIRCHNPVTWNLLSAIELDSTMPLEPKNVETLSTEVTFTGTELQNREWALTSERNRAMRFEFHALHELGFGCGLVKDAAVDSTGLIYTGKLIQLADS